MAKPKPILRWQGGKSRLLKAILPRIEPHHCFVEAFAGGLAVMAAKPPSRVEVVNDINSDLVSLYRCVQYHLPALIDEIKWVPSSRQVLKDYLAQPGLTEIQRAARFLLRNRMSFGGGGTSYGVSKLGGGGAATSRQGLVDILERFRARFDRVSVENLPYQRLMTIYDAPTTFWFLDPPYLNAEIDCYAGWNEAQMTEFAALVADLQGNWLVTVDDSPLNRHLFARHKLTAVKTLNGALNRRLLPKQTFGELIIQRKTAVAVQSLPVLHTVPRTGGDGHLHDVSHPAGLPVGEGRKQRPLSLLGAVGGQHDVAGRREAAA